MTDIKKYSDFLDDDFTGPKGFEKWDKHREELKNNPEYLKRWKKEQNIKLKDWWNQLKPFKKSTDVPQIPSQKNPIYDFCIVRLIELGAIPKSELEDGQWYYGNFRNSEFGRWNSEKNEFEYINYSFGHYWDSCEHFQDDRGFALFVPLRKVTESEMIEINKLIDLVENKTGNK